MSNPMRDLVVGSANRSVASVEARDAYGAYLFHVMSTETDDGKAVFVYLPRDGSRKDTVVYLRREEAICLCASLVRLLKVGDGNDKTDATDSSRDAGAQPSNPVCPERPSLFEISSWIPGPGND